MAPPPPRAKPPIVPSKKGAGQAEKVTIVWGLPGGWHGACFQRSAPVRAKNLARFLHGGHQCGSLVPVNAKGGLWLPRRRVLIGRSGPCVFLPKCLRINDLHKKPFGSRYRGSGKGVRRRGGPFPLDCEGFVLSA